MILDRKSIFTNKDVKIYYANPDDPKTLIQEDYWGRKVVGTMNETQFVALENQDEHQESS